MKRASGFTLIELMVTIAVLSILIVVAVPNFRTTIQNNRLVTQANDLLGTLLYARSQALTNSATTGGNITVCASSDGSSCLSGATSWKNGWIVCQEPDTTTTDCSGATVLRVHPALSGENTLYGGGVGAAVSYSKSGFTTSNGYFGLCDSRGASYGRAIYLSATGEARVSPTVGKELDGSTSVVCTP